MLGSDAKEDKCGICGGDDSSCHVISGIFDREIFNTGYNDILLIPPFATSILIEEVIPNSNYFAVRNISGYYYLNGNWKIEYPGDFTIAGVEFHYERKHDLSQPERLWSAGPTLEPLFIVLLYQERNPGIRYEYSVPVEDKLVPTATYIWETEDFQECSKTCSGGEQHRLVYCKQSENNVKVEENLCDIGKKPQTTRECNTQPCPAMWHVGDWSQCSQSCAAGVQYRLIYCQQLINGGVLAVTNDGQCELDDSSKPPFYQICNLDVECPRWHVGPWSACNRICGPGNQTREVTCETGMQETIVLDESHCDLTNMPPIMKVCSLRPCEGVEWIVTEWSGCSDKCGPQKESREVYCSNSKGEVFSDELCHNKPIPRLTRPCPKVKPCSALWHTSEWSRCSAKCGTGVQTRFVFCGIWKGDSVKKVSDSNCKKSKKFTSVRNCTRTPCKGSWFSGPWSKCSVTCGGGTRTRKILCFHKDSVVSSSRCDPSLIPPNNETCNEQSCVDVVSTETSVNCSESEYGCCPDGKTVAGPNLDDCPAEPDCEESYYGCCLDGFTAASGPFGVGCPDITTCNETKYGCCSDGNTIAKGPKFQGCPDVRECELTPFKCCPNNITVATGPNQEGCDNVTETCDMSEFGCCPDNVTFAMGPDHEGCDNVTKENVTETCDTSEFGCCPDNVTFAMGPDHEGCDNVTKENVTETCDTSEFGCCPDNVTFAMGPDHEGCDNVTKENVTETCDTSEYGCCLDNVTFAMGPNHEGCDNVTKENVTETCDTSEFGCCPDNVTFAMGPDHEGCDNVTKENVTETCDMSEFGCCPDNVTFAMGPDHEGCDNVTKENVTETCDMSEFGCCPDNVTFAMGPDHEGCDNVTKENVTETCDMSEFGCCPDNVTFAMGPDHEGCDNVTKKNVTETCDTSEFGCCPDNVTFAMGPDHEGCDNVTKENVTETCDTSEFGCCPDNVTFAMGPDHEGCDNVTKENVTETCDTSEYGCCLDNVTFAMGPNHEGCDNVTKENVTETCDTSEFGCCPDNVTFAMGLDHEGCDNVTKENVTETCDTSEFGCCPDNVTFAMGPDHEGCDNVTKENVTETCDMSEFGCCLDNVTFAMGPDHEGCDNVTKENVTETCDTSEFGCCPDNVTFAMGPDHEGCDNVTKENVTETCDMSEFGCCPDNVTFAMGPDHEGCDNVTKENVTETCDTSEFGCCPDNVTFAMGPDHEGCDNVTKENVTETCDMSEFGCCPDNVTFAMGPDHEGCDNVTKENVTETCDTSEFGCCPDNVTFAMGPDHEGCDNVTKENVTETCDTSEFGCCPDNVTFAMGPDHEGCDNVTKENVTETCDTSEFGCCPDNVTFAMGPDHEGCDNVTKENVTETCDTSEFGCCPDNVTFAMGPDHEGCDNVTKENSTETCVNVTFALRNESCEPSLSDPVLSDDSSLNSCYYSDFGCCPDNKSVALGPDNVGCPCSTLEYGCCADNITPALGPNQSGCYCEISVYGCCQDDYTMASGPDFQGCNCEEMLYKCCPDGITPMTSPWGEGCSCQELKYGCCPDGSTSAAGENYYGCPCDTLPFGCCQDKRTPAKGENYDGCPCNTTEFGCCPDGKTPATSNKYAGCPCISMKFGCCPDGVTAATGPSNAGCSCENTTYGCCPDKKTPAKGPNSAGCSCSTFPHGCCPDGKTSALGPNFMGCSCHTMKFGCCPDGFTPATGPGDEGCTCESLPFKCCPDDKTPAKGLNFAGCHCSTFPYGCCPDNRTVSVGSNYAGCTCHSMQHGCCPDGVTIAEGPNYKGCSCSSFSYGCCPDDLTIAEGPNHEGCPCSTFPHGCCPDGTTVAIGPDFKGCPGADFPKPLAAEICHLEHEIGSCQNYSVKWYFDVTYGGCSRFWYGGCEGNGNRFNTQEDCEKLCVSPEGKAACFLPKVDGSCDGKFPSWYYNSQTKQCEEFIYKGCLGNNNRFISKEICEQTCTSQVVPVPVSPVSLDICDLPKKEGTCTAAVIYWYFNIQTQTCEQFYYSGCDGNDNRFETLSDCENRCLAKKEKDICKLPQVIGNCYDFKQRWYFDVKRKECKSFYYSGCNGNNNNFGSYHECEKQCGKSVTTVKPEKFKIDYCFLDQDSGPCPNREIRWYYDKTDGVCKEFYYGGCEGNGNRFQSRRECETKCTYSQDICKLPKVQGSCSGSFVQWYYSHSTDECVEFMFSGCQGNANRFDDKERCEKYCKITSTPHTQDICTMSRDSGPCLGEYTQWYYDVSTNSCKKFKYGGCQGNNNRFQSRRDCELRCVKKLREELHTTTYSTISHDNADICHMPADTGLCNKFYARWFYDPSSKTCLPFVYTGCGGNKNRFKTFDICMKFCGEAKENIPDATTKLPCPVSNCDQLQCPFGKEEKADEHGCTYCRCSNPCEVHICPEDSRCAIEIYRTIEGEPRAQPICRLINKLGECPKIESKAADPYDTECTERCRLDSDCRDDRKCCFNGCTNVCMDPIFETTTILTSEINEIDREDSSIQPTEFNETTTLGSTVFLICKVAKGSTFTWSRNNNPLQVDDNHITILSNGTLFIQRIEENDHGSYLCITRDNYGQSKVYTFHLQVQVPVRILPGPTLVIVQLSQPATLQCTATGFPNPIVSWWRDKTMLPTTSARFQQFPDYSLLIRTVTYQDIGVYTCQAYNGIGAMATLDISVRLSKGSDTKSNVDFDNENTLKETSTDSISPITEKEMAPVDLSVEIKTINSKVKVGDLVQLDCIVKGTDLSTVTWYFNNNVIQIDDKLKLLPNNTLLISNIQNAHSGNYRCHAQYDSNQASASVAITVEDSSDGVPEGCVDDPRFSNCNFIVKARYCSNKYYEKYCCRSCYLAKETTVN
ncbi:papilin-like isoform X2 [Centruroides vittatus]